jgi:hypothetical protein
MAHLQLNYKKLGGFSARPKKFGSAAYGGGLGVY